MAGDRTRQTHVVIPRFAGGSAQVARGFTLVELLVALFVLSLVAVLGWRGLDGMVRTQSRLKDRADEVLTLQVGLAQWRADLDAVVSMPGLPAIEWNGQVLRLLRRAEGPAGPAVMVTAWTRRSDEGGSRWRRWQSLPTHDRSEVQAAWQQADLWARNPGATERAREAALVPMDDWQVFFYRGDAWINPQSSDAQQADTGQPGRATGASAGSRGGDSSTTLPDGVRVVLQFPATAALPGALTLDWVSPRVAGTRQ